LLRFEKNKYQNIKTEGLMNPRPWLVISVIIAALSMAAYSQQMPGMQHPQKIMKPGQGMATMKAIAIISPAPGGKVHGEVSFLKTEGGIKIVADVTGLTPGKHGFHIHEFGDCSAADLMSAGGHFLIPGESHGAPGEPDSHKGDLGNLEADSSGMAHYEWLDPNISLTGANSIIGRSVIIHASVDDLKTQPAGNAGARVACGTIGIAKP
jgi:superoxide dismutase, Cu-Zn family